MNTFARAALIGLVPGLVLGAFVATWWVDVPYLDQWELVPLLAAWEGGTLRWADIWAQHNEHRLVFPKLLMLATAALTDWDVRYEMAASLLLAFVCYGLVALFLHRARAPRYTPVLAGLLVFSPSQWGNWFLGWQVQIFLMLVSLLIVLALLPRPGGPGFAGAIAAAVVASFSFGSGLLVWPAGLLAIAWARPPRRATRLALWTLAGGGTVAAYLWGYARVGYHPEPAPLAATLGRAGYALAYLGSPLSQQVWLAMPLGGAALAALTYATLRLDRNRHAALLALGWFGVGAALLTAWVRAGYGLEQALSSRYVTLANLAWLGALPGFGSLRGARRHAAAGVLATLLVLQAFWGAYTWTLRYPAYAEARAALQAGGNPQSLTVLYPDTEVLHTRRAQLEARGLSVFRDPP